jgi:capsular polysaccharide export protein
VWADADQDLALVAALAGRPVRLFGQGRFTGADQDAAAIAARTLGECHYLSPFDGSEWSALQAIEQLRQWRHLIDANRAIDAVVGVARWKRVTLDPLLWNGTGPVPHTRRLPSNLSDNAQVVVWKSRTPARLLAELEASGAALGELEDGFIRSTGLGANCVPPLSAIVDFSGVYFDPANPSDLETLLEYGAIGSTDCERAAALKERLVATGITKYGQGSKAISTAGNGQRRILVTGQVEDDRSILSGGKGLSNLELLQRVRALESGAWIVYKPHPDVEAGHRNGFVPSTEALRYADEIQRDAPITALIDAVDGLHVITSLAGFEALLRGKPVTTHGVPFYAGWGLTRDLGDVPPRRTRKRSLDELVAATLLLYPRYLDPITRLPCHAELLVERMAAGEATVTSPLVTLREWQGRAQAMWRRMVGGR